MRKINAKLFLVLLLGGTATVGIAFAVHHFQYRRIATALLWHARQAAPPREIRPRPDSSIVPGSGVLIDPTVG